MVGSPCFARVLRTSNPDVRKAGVDAAAAYDNDVMNEHAVASAHELLIREGGMHTSCSSFGNCTILDSVDYDPAYPVPYWHQHMGLATICICNSLTRKIWRETGRRCGSVDPALRRRTRS